MAYLVGGTSCKIVSQRRADDAVVAGAPGVSGVPVASVGAPVAAGGPAPIGMPIAGSAVPPPVAPQPKPGDSQPVSMSVPVPVGIKERGESRQSDRGYGY